MYSWRRLTLKGSTKEVFVHVAKAVMVEAIPGGGCTIWFSGLAEDKVQVNEAISVVLPMSDSSSTASS